MFRFLMNKRYAHLLFSIAKGKNIQQLSRDPQVHMTVSHLSNVTAQWRQEGLITKEAKGRETEIKLTEFGEKWLEIVKQYINLANKIAEQKEGENEGQS